jgi:hypothetical protein
MRKTNVIPMSEVKDKAGRADVLLHGIASRLMARFENTVNLPGLAEGVMPLLEAEIKKHVPATKVIPKKYEKLAHLVSERLR